jgi:hypothetical protein
MGTSLSHGIMPLANIAQVKYTCTVLTKAYLQTSFYRYTTPGPRMEKVEIGEDASCITVPSTMVSVTNIQMPLVAPAPSRHGVPLAILALV